MNLSMAANYVDMMVDKAKELHGLTESEVRGHHLGDPLVASASSSVESLSRALSRLRTAIDVAHGIDVTVEVPDEEPTD